MTFTLVASGPQASNGLSGNTVVKTGPGRVVRVSVTTAGAVGQINDASSVANAAASNLIGVVPAVVGIYYFDWPVLNGIVYQPGAAQVASITYE
jgi:hypothetical protein